MNSRVGLAALMLLAVACGSGGGGDDSDDTLPTVLYPNVGYGLVNWWDRTDPRAFADALADAHIGLTEIEARPRAEPYLSGAYTTFLTQMRAKNITVFVSMVNWNAPAARAMSLGDFTAMLADIIAHGTDGVILAPVSEPDNSAKANQFIKAARANWTGQFAVPGNFAHVALPFDWQDVHYCDLARLERELLQLVPKRIFNTDCTPILNPGPDKSMQLATLARQTGNYLLIYDNAGQTPDWTTIAAIGQVLQ